MKNYILLFALFPLISFPQTNISYEDKIRIAEAKRISDMYGEKLWQGWEKTHFALVLIYDEVEFLINHPNPSDDFSLIGFDTLLIVIFITDLGNSTNIFLQHFLLLMV